MNGRGNIDSRNKEVFRETWKVAPENYNDVGYSEEFEVLNAWKEYYNVDFLLDAGCGKGRLMDFFSHTGVRNIVFVDISDAIFQAKCDYDARYSDKFDALFIKANLKYLPIKDKRIDVTSSLGVVHHTDNQELAIGEILRVTKKNFLLGIITEKRLLGKMHIFPNFLKPMINRIDRFDLLFGFAGIITVLGLTLVYVLHYTGISRLLSLRVIIGKIVNDKNRFDKLRFCIYDIIIAPTYTKNSDLFYIESVEKQNFHIREMITTSVFDYYGFEIQKI